MRLNLDELERDLDSLSGPWSQLGGEKEVVLELIDRARLLAAVQRDLRGLLAEAAYEDCVEHEPASKCAHLCTTWRTKLRGVATEGA